MKKFWVWLIMAAVVAALFYFVQTGVIHWQPLTILVAALLAPFKFIGGLFGDREKEIREAHRKVREREAAFQADLEGEIARREARVKTLRDQVDGLEARVQTLESRRAALTAEIEGLSDDDLLARGRRALG